MALNDFLGKRWVKESKTQHEQVGHEVTISVVLECGDCRTHFPMTYYADGPERLEGRYGDGHKISITRQADSKRIDCTIDGDPGGVDTGSWTADDRGDGSDGE